MAPGKLENSAQYSIKWRQINKKMVPNVVLASLIGRYFYLRFL